MTLHVVVTGPMGVGKSTTARALAAHLGRAICDSDQDIETLFDTTGGEIVRTAGVEALHALESAVLLGGLARTEPTVIAAAGSVIENPWCCRAMANRAFVVVLDVEPDELVTRAATAGHRRPIPAVEMRALASRRDPLYESSADLMVDAQLTTPEIVATIVDAL